MAAPKRLVLFVEGDGDVAAAPALIGKLLNEMQASDALFLDSKPLRIGGVTSLFSKKARNWTEKLLVAAKRGNLGGVLLLQDGDMDAWWGQRFCARDIGRDLSRRARATGAGSVFSVASVFACQEFESWLIAGIESLAGKSLANGRIVIPANLKVPESDLEQHPRDAKGWLNHYIPRGYNPITDQEFLTRAVDVNAIRQRNPRSFRRLESALRQLVEAIRSGKHIVTPSEQPPQS
ncbi:MAG TPA: DUF4276 family protein [Gemmataceae bacterium]|nr:DUF4276 family protein [Gemmataceae bacterium]